MSNDAKHEIHRFNHDAMASPFQLLICGEEREYARQASAAAFALLDEIEDRLSKYRQGSDVSQINALTENTTARIGIHALECLRLSAEACELTGGAFDVTIGPLMRIWRDAEGNPRTPSDEDVEAARACVGLHHLELNDKGFEVTAKRDGVRVDLGGIGKGYAVDQMAQLLDDWSIESALLSGGESTLLALDAPHGKAGWVLGAGGGKGTRTPEKVTLVHRALSGSGVALQGRHIMDPHTGRPAAVKEGAWALAPSAGLADALSTAFMVMANDAIEALCAKRPDIGALLLDDGKLTRIGAWESDSIPE